MKTAAEIKTFEDACKVLDLDPKKVLPDFSIYPKEDQEAMTAHAKLIQIVKAANKLDNGGELWKPDWNDYDEYKYFPWFDMASPGFRFYDFDTWCSVSFVGSRLCFKSRATCELIAEQFIDLYKQYYE